MAYMVKIDPKKIHQNLENSKTQYENLVKNGKKWLFLTLKIQNNYMILILKITKYTQNNQINQNSNCTHWLAEA